MLQYWYPNVKQMRFEHDGALSALPVDGVAEFTLPTSQPGLMEGATVADVIPQPLGDDLIQQVVTLATGWVIPQILRDQLVEQALVNRLSITLHFSQYSTMTRFLANHCYSEWSGMSRCWLHQYSFSFHMYASKSSQQNIRNITLHNKEAIV